MFEFSNGGSRIREIREPVMRDGHLVVEVVGKEDLQDYINSFGDSVDVELLVARAVNEPEILNQRQGMYGDFTEFPKTYAEVLDKITSATNLFNSLPVDVRSRFSNDVYTFISEMDKKDWAVKAGFVQPESSSDVNESEVK